MIFSPHWDSACKHRKQAKLKQLKEGNLKLEDTECKSHCQIHFDGDDDDDDDEWFCLNYTTDLVVAYKTIQPVCNIPNLSSRNYAPLKLNYFLNYLVVVMYSLAGLHPGLPVIPPVLKKPVGLGLFLHPKLLSFFSLVYWGSIFLPLFLPSLTILFACLLLL